MEHYLVTANTYTGGYGLELTLFGVFPTKEAALEWIMNHQEVHWISGSERHELFNFFEHYDKQKYLRVYEEQSDGRMLYVGSRTQTKDEYALAHYVTCFADNHPILLDCYVE